MIKRPEKDKYYLDIARVVSTRSTCLKVLIGAIIVRDDQIIATGYVGAPRNTKSSLEHGFCLRRRLNIPSGTQYELCRSVHAEQNAIINAARAGVSILNGDMYIYGELRDSKKTINAFPCFICKKMIINAGIKRVIVSVEDEKRDFKVFYVNDWIEYWKEHDIIEDKYKYGNKENSLYIALTGRMGSGKGEVVNILKEKGFQYISLSDIVREEVRKLNRDVTRTEMQNIGNSLREREGAGVLGKRVRDKILSSEHRRWVIDGIRNPAEIIELKRLSNFYLFAIDSDIDLIIKRMKSRKRKTDKVSDNELRKAIDREWGIGEPEDGQQVGKCVDMSDFLLKNNSSLKELKDKVLNILNQIDVKNEKR